MMLPVFVILSAFFFVLFVGYALSYSDLKREHKSLNNRYDDLYVKHSALQKDNKHLIKVNTEQHAQLNRAHRILQLVRRDIESQLLDEDPEIDWEYIAKHQQYGSLIRALNRLENVER